MTEASSSRIILVISDLHLSQGWDEEGKISTNEDFFFDHSFSRFIKFYIKKSQEEEEKEKRNEEKGKKEERKRRIDLIIAGDMMDLLQVTLCPKESETFTEEITKDERVFGLGTSPYKSNWKLRKIMHGHEKFFQALAEFLMAGNSVTILPGNHDIELSLPEVQDCFREELLSEEFRPKDVGRQDLKKAIKENLFFKPWFYFEPGLVYVEHGHQYDSLNSFDYFLHPLGLKNFIYLPAGSFFVRYLFNKLENEYPFADNIKPVSRFICFSLWKPRLWLELPKYYRFFQKTLNKAGPIDKLCAAEMDKKQEKLMEDLVEEIQKNQGEGVNEPVITSKKLEGIQEMWEDSALHQLKKFQLFLRFLCGESQRTARKSFCAVAQKIADIMDVRYVVFGHTHEARLERLENNGKNKEERREYVNTGTWTKVFAEGYTEKLLKEENEFVYVMIDTGEPKMELLRWRDDLNDGERVRLFQSRGAQEKCSENP